MFYLHVSGLGNIQARTTYLQLKHTSSKLRSTTNTSRVNGDLLLYYYYYTSILTIEMEETLFINSPKRRGVNVLSGIATPLRLWEFRLRVFNDWTYMFLLDDCIIVWIGMKLYNPHNMSLYMAL